MGASLSVLFVLFGAFSILSQTVVLREYLVIYGGNELALGLFFSTWLFWVGTGAVLAGRVARRIAPGKTFLPLALVYSATPIVQTALIRSLKLLAGVPPMEVFPLDRLFVVTFVSNLPLSLLTGALFTMGASIAAGEGKAERAVSRVYLLEALGGFGGGALATALAAWSVSAIPILLGAACAMAGGVLAASLPGRRRMAVAAGALAALAALALATPLGRGLERATVKQRWKATLPEARLVESFETPYRNIQLARLGTQGMVLFDGKVAAAFPSEADPAEDAALVMSQSRGARSVLVIGLAATGLVRELLGYGVEEIVLVEQDRRMLERLREFLPERDRDALEDPRVEIVGEDPRSWLEETERAFDLVIVRTPDPSTAQMNRLYTVEFFRAVRERLEPGGVLTTRMTSAENYLGSEVERYGRSIFASLSEVFPHVVVTPGERCFLFASSHPGTITDDAGELVRRHADLGPRGSRFHPEIFHSILEPGRVAFVRGIYEREPGPDERVGVNTDARPITYLAQLLVLGRTLDSRIPEVLDAAGAAGIWIALVPLLVFGLMRVRHLAIHPAPSGPGSFNAAALAAAAGFISISLDIVLLGAYQSRFGSLFLNVGLMNALFMAGLALGALACRRLLVHGSWRWPAVMGIAAAVGALASGLPWILASGPPEEAFAALFLACGLFGGAAFPAAGALHPETGGSTLAALLESADHWGGAAGGILAGVVFLPLLGTEATCLVLGAGAGGILLLVAHQRALVARAPGKRGIVGRLALILRAHAKRSAFPWHGASALLAGLVLASLALGWIVRARTDRPRVRLTSTELRSLAGERGAEERRRPFVHYRLAPEPGEEAGGLVMSSLTVAGDVKGYGGPINLVLVVSGDGKIERVRLLESKETPIYIEGIGSWLEGSFEGRGIERDFFLRSGADDRPDEAHGVDALTGATVTARAAVASVNASKNAAAGVLGITVSGAPPASPWTGFGEPAVVYLIAALLAAILLYRWGFPRSSPWPRRAFLAVNLILGGFVFNTQLSMEHVTRLLRLEFPGPENAELLVLMAGAAILAAAFGPLYCGSLCPFGAAQELLSLLGLGVRPSAPVERRTRYLRYVVLAGFVAGWMLTGSKSLMGADPLQHVFAGKLSGAALVLVLVALALSLFSFRFWCRTFCPVGALLSLCGRIGLLVGLAPRKRYELCDLGATRDRDTECLHCNRCLTASTLTQERLKRKLVRFPRSAIDRWTRMAVAGVIIVFVGVVLVGRPEAPDASTPSAGTPRQVEIDLIRSLIEEKKLSDKEALYWRRIDETARAQPTTTGNTREKEDANID